MWVSGQALKERPFWKQPAPAGPWLLHEQRGQLQSSPQPLLLESLAETLEVEMEHEHLPRHTGTWQGDSGHSHATKNPSNFLPSFLSLSLFLFDLVTPFWGALGRGYCFPLQRKDTWVH